MFHGFLSICTLHAAITSVVNIETVETHIPSDGVWQLRDHCSFDSLVFVTAVCNGLMRLETLKQMCVVVHMYFGVKVKV